MICPNLTNRTYKMKIKDYLIRRPVAAMSRNGKPFININEEVLLRAVRGGYSLKVWGSTVIDPKKWLETGSLRLKVFKRPNEPMRLIGNWVENENQPTLMSASEKERELSVGRISSGSQSLSCLDGEHVTDSGSLSFGGS